MENKYKLFYGFCFYPSGGWDEFKGYFESEEQAREYLDKHERDPFYMWAHIVFEDKIIRQGAPEGAGTDTNHWVWRNEE